MLSNMKIYFKATKYNEYGTEYEEFEIYSSRMPNTIEQLNDILQRESSKLVLTYISQKQSTDPYPNEIFIGKKINETNNDVAYLCTYFVNNKVVDDVVTFWRGPGRGLLSFDSWHVCFDTKGCKGRYDDGKFGKKINAENIKREEASSQARKEAEDLINETNKQARNAFMQEAMQGKFKFDKGIGREFHSHFEREIRKAASDQVSKKDRGKTEALRTAKKDCKQYIEDCDEDSIFDSESKSSKCFKKLSLKYHPDTLSPYADEAIFKEMQNCLQPPSQPDRSKDDVVNGFRSMSHPKRKPQCKKPFPAKKQTHKKSPPLKRK